jgi:hypothetical protein
MLLRLHERALREITEQPPTLLIDLVELCQPNLEHPGILEHGDLGEYEFDHGGFGNALEEVSLLRYLLHYGDPSLDRVESLPTGRGCVILQGEWVILLFL